MIHILDLLQAAEAIEPLVRGYPVQKLPFTSTVDANGMLTCGCDPDVDVARLLWTDQESWRIWIVKIALQLRFLSLQNEGHSLPYGMEVMWLLIG